ncbi:MAG: YlmC/YmxH family sporulation protein [Clostridia bacterium]|nr:YlmC/YmxH family sporulation protein [Clostridia bacterium]
MDITLTELKEKEIINVFDGKKLGHIIDVLFDIENGLVRGIVVPGERKIFKKSEDIFIPLEKLKKIGDDVVLVKLQVQNEREFGFYQGDYDKKKSKSTANYYKHLQMENYKNRNAVGQKEQRNPEHIIKSQSQSNYRSYVRFKPINNKKYK